MANEEVLGPRKTMFVLVIVVGCFAVLWPRILSPLVVGPARDKLQPNQLDREAGCCEVMFEKELAVLEMINEVCSSAVHVNGKLSPYAAAECRKAVNETCGLDIAAFLKRSDNIGKSSRILVDAMKSSNSSCLKEHFGVPVISLSPHIAFNSWTFQDTVKQERSPIRGAGPHPALRERGRAIPAGTPPAPARSSHITLPPNVRVRNSPLAVYYDTDIKPPPIPGMRPPLGSPGGPVQAPKSSMGFVMPIYTICIIVFFVYTISKIFFKRATASPYETVIPDPQFRRRVFREDSRTTPDKLGPKERDTIVSAISGLVAEVRQQMETGYDQNRQNQEAQDNARPYTNGKVIHSSGPVHIIASEYQENSQKIGDDKEKSPEPVEKETSPEPKESPEDQSPVAKEESPEPKEDSPQPKEQSPELESKAQDDPSKDLDELEPETNQDKAQESDTEDQQENDNESTEPKEIEPLDNESEPTTDDLIENHKESVLIDLTKPIEVKKNGDVKHNFTADFIEEEVRVEADNEKTKELLEEAIDEELDGDQENASVKVMGMELVAHSADGGVFPSAPAHAPPAAAPARSHEAAEVTSIFLETEIPQQTRVLVADFAQDRPDQKAPKHSPMVVSGKMTLSLIQDAPRDTPERDAESTVDDFTTASAFTQNAAEKDENQSDDEGDLEEEEIEIEEIEEEIEIEDDEEEEQEEEGNRMN